MVLVVMVILLYVVVKKNLFKLKKKINKKYLSKVSIDKNGVTVLHG